MTALILLLLIGLLVAVPVAVVGGAATEPRRPPIDVPGAPAWAAAVREIAPRTGHVPDPSTADPTVISRFLAGLTPDERELLIERAPETMGNLDGVPVSLRYVANEIAMREATPMRAASTMTLTRTGRTLGWDPRGNGRAVQVLGDLEDAEHIAVLVPGTGWRPDNVIRRPCGDRRSPIDSAIALQQAVGDGERLAIVVWLGYDRPQRIDRSVISSERAIAGAPALIRFVAGLPEAHTTLLAHSYGTVVCGRAASRARAQDIVALGAPGMDAYSVAGLRTTARVWAARTADDPIRFTPYVRVLGAGHGADPTGPTYGARVFRTGVSRGHDEYYLPGSESLANIARIVLGRPAEVTLRRV